MENFKFKIISKIIADKLAPFMPSYMTGTSKIYFITKHMEAL